MTLTITTARTRVAQLLDDPTNQRYTANQIVQALRTALDELTMYQPITRTYIVDTDGKRRLAIPTDMQATGILSVELWDSDPAADDALEYAADYVDEQWILEFPATHTPAASQMLTVKYTTAHFVDGLDGAAGTTTPFWLENALCMGAAGFAAQERAASRSESVNLQPNVLSQLLKLAETYLTKFRAAAQGKPKPTAAAPEYTEPTGY